MIAPPPTRLALHNHSACCVTNGPASLPRHHESTGKETPRSLVTRLGLDGKNLSPGSYRRAGGICLDIPFYRTALSVTGILTVLIIPIGRGGPPVPNLIIRTGGNLRSGV